MPGPASGARVAPWLHAAAMAALCVGLGAPAAAVADTAAQATPEPGRYDAQLCVAQSTATDAAQSAASASTLASCGAVVVDWQRGGLVRVVLGDVRYRLELRRREVAVVVMHGTVQIDDFLAAYEQSDAALVFIDSARATHYELRLGTLQRTVKTTPP